LIFLPLKKESCFFFVKIVIFGGISALTQGYYAIDDIDIRDSYCGTYPPNAAVDTLTTPSSVTRPPASTQSLSIQ
jgi:hypothetical protein